MLNHHCLKLDLDFGQVVVCSVAGGVELLKGDGRFLSLKWNAIFLPFRVARSVLYPYVSRISLFVFGFVDGWILLDEVELTSEFLQERLAHVEPGDACMEEENVFYWNSF